MGQAENRIERPFRVRFAQIDGAHVIYYPRYLEMVSETFPEATLPATPFDITIRFMQSNRLGDDIRMQLDSADGGWCASGHMNGEHFRIETEHIDEVSSSSDVSEQLASFHTAVAPVGAWMCGPDGKLQISRYYELISNTIEQWFETSLGVTFHELHIVRQLGIPTVQLNTRCHEMPASGDAVQMWLRPASVGGSAVQLQTWLVRAGKVLLETSQVIVFVELNDKKIETIKIPVQMREGIAAQLAVAASE